MLEANPNLGWRDVKHILVNSAEKNDPGNAGWTNNAAGHHINHAYGFGTVDVNTAATLASTWVNVGPEVSATSQSPFLGLAIPDGITSSYTNPVYGAAVSNSLLINSPIKIETVEVSVNITHPYRGDLQFLLTAPTGTQSILGALRPDSGDNYSNWVFTTTRDWDELATGMWTLSIRDGYLADLGTFNSWSISVFGTVIPEPATMSLLVMAILATASFRRRNTS
jgi:subtilisin-like proprotein convertase family protein